MPAAHPDHSTNSSTTGPRPRRFALGTLERRVFLVAVAGMLPVALLSCALLLSSARQQKADLLRVSEDTMFALVSAVDAELKSTIATLDALAASPRLAREDFAGLREEANELLARRPGWLNVVVMDADRHVMNAQLPENATLPGIQSRQLIADVFRTHEPLVGEVRYAPVIDRYAVVVLVPYFRDEEVRYVISAVLRPEYFLELLDLENMAREGVIGIFDRHHNVVARSLNQQQSVGRPAAPGLGKMLQTGVNRGGDVTKTLEGMSVYTVFRRSAFSGWSAAIGIPTQSVDGPVVRSYVVLGGAVVASVLLGLIAATLVGRTIVSPMSELEQSAARVGRGEAPSRPRTRLAEVQRVAVALAKAHDEREASFQREREARLSAESASKAKDEFLAMLGHELRNPIAAINNASQLLEHKRASLDAGTASAISIITRQARHLTRMTDDLLDAGRVILGKISLTRAPLDLAAAVEASIAGLRNLGRVGDHALEVSLEPAWIFADATRIEQVIGNLMTNALKYTPAGGSVTVRTRREAGDAVLVVADTGIGLDAELLPRAFDLFVQGARALDRSQGGLGIGLTLVRRLTELHGGSVAAQSAGGGCGATFIVRLPAVEPPAILTTQGAQSAAHLGCHVGLIEDNEDMRMSLRMLLELEEQQVYEAADGPAGLALLCGDPRITVAFVDVGLPGMSGFEVARAVRAQRGASIRLIAMSGYGSQRDVAQGMESGFDAYLVKPAQIEALREEIAKGPKA